MNTHHKPTHTDPIQAATDKYGPGVPVPGLTAASPDDVLIVHLHRGDPISPIAAEIERIYVPARLQFAAPAAILDGRQVEFRDRNRALMGTVPLKSYDNASRTVPEWHRDIALLRSCLDHREWLTTFLARWAILDGTKRAAELEQFASGARTKAYQGSVGAVASLATPDWRGFVAGLARDGIIITPAGDGNLTVTNADRLPADVRARVVLNKVAILATLGKVETF